MTGLITDGVLHTAVRTPYKVAVICGAESITYAELAMRARGVAVAVDQRQARRVALSLGNGIPFLEVFLGATIGGAVAMVMDPRWPQTLLRDMASAHAPHVIFAAASVDGIETVTTDAYVAWRASHNGSTAIKTRPRSDMPFFMGFTSGTTGKPKAFIRSHASWAASFHASKAEMGISAGNRVLAPGPLSHGLTLYAAIEALNAGGTVLLHPQFDAALAVRQLAAGEADTFVGVPTMLDLLVEAAGSDAISGVKRIITAGAKLSAPLRQKLSRTFPSAAVIEYYGASELSFVTIAKTGDGCPADSVGRAFRDVEVQVRRADDTPAKADEIGLVWVRSAMLSSGYVGETDGTGFRTDGKGWATVGDYGHFDARGFLHLAGRENEMMISGGHNVYPAEIERILTANPNIAACAVLGLPDPRWGEVVAAVVMPRGEVKRADLEQACAAALPPSKMPRRWFTARTLPRNAVGKVVKAVLRDDIMAKRLTELE